MKKRLDLIGQKFGRLTVIDRGKDDIGNDGRRYPKWICRCECGKIVSVKQHHLKSGGTKSCGCYKSERISNINKTKSGKCSYDLTSKEYGIGYTPKGYEFWFDKEDY